MANYKGQTFNPKEDHKITTQSLFKVIDKDTGEAVDVRELLGITEEDFKDNPELLDIIKQMNLTEPVPEEEFIEADTGIVSQKRRHRRFLNYDIIGMEVDLGNTENLVGEAPPSLDWAQWWERKEKTNAQLVDAIQN